jgi:hypothetical protein
MIRYIIGIIDPIGLTSKYISRYTPPSGKNSLPKVEYTMYRMRAQIFSADEVKAIPKEFGEPVEVKM